MTRLNAAFKAGDLGWQVVRLPDGGFEISAECTGQAQAGGLKPGDRIVELNGHPVDPSLSIKEFTKSVLTANRPLDVTLDRASADAKSAGKDGARNVFVTFAPDGRQQAIKSAAKTVLEFKRDVLAATGKSVATLYCGGDEEFLADTVVLTAQQCSAGLVAKEAEETAWYGAADEEGNTYWYNEVSGACSWEKPPVVEAHPQYLHTEDPPAVVKALMTGAMGKMDKELARALRKAQTTHTAAEKARDKAVAAGEAQHWVEAWDSAHAAYYYYDTISHDMTWDKPSTYVMAADEETFRAAIRIQCCYRSRTQRKIVAARRGARQSDVDADLGSLLMGGGGGGGGGGGKGSSGAAGAPADDRVYTIEFKEGKLGLGYTAQGSGKFEVTTASENGQAALGGVALGDSIVSVTVGELGKPAKKWAVMGNTKMTQQELTQLVTSSARPFTMVFRRREVAKPDEAPGVPRITRVMAKSEEAWVWFDPPANIEDADRAGGSSYTATAGGNSASGPGSPLKVTGLDNNVSVTFAVSARNKVGDSGNGPTPKPGTAEHALRSCTPASADQTKASVALQSVCRGRASRGKATSERQRLERTLVSGEMEVFESQVTPEMQEKWAREYDMDGVEARLKEERMGLSKGFNSKNVGGGVNHSALKSIGVTARWVKEYDPSSQRHFFTSVETGEVTWDPPPDYDEDEEEEEQVKMAALKIQCSFRGNIARGEVEAKLLQTKADLVTLWEEHFDAAKSEVYYVNTQTGERVTERPQSLIDGDDDKMRSVIKIQSSFRCRLANRQAKEVRKRRAQLEEEYFPHDVLVAAFGEAGALPGKTRKYVAFNSFQREKMYAVKAALGRARERNEAMQATKPEDIAAAEEELARAAEKAAGDDAAAAEAAEKAATSLYGRKQREADEVAEKAKGPPDEDEVGRELAWQTLRRASTLETTADVEAGMQLGDNFPVQRGFDDLDEAYGAARKQAAELARMAVGTVSFEAIEGKLDELASGGAALTGHLRSAVALLLRADAARLFMAHARISAPVTMLTEGHLVVATAGAGFAVRQATKFDKLDSAIHNARTQLHTANSMVLAHVAALQDTSAAHASAEADAAEAGEDAALAVAVTEARAAAAAAADAVAEGFFLWHFQVQDALLAMSAAEAAAVAIQEAVSREKQRQQESRERRAMMTQERNQRFVANVLRLRDEQVQQRDFFVEVCGRAWAKGKERLRSDVVRKAQAQTAAEESERQGRRAAAQRQEARWQERDDEQISPWAAVKDGCAVGALDRLLEEERRRRQYQDGRIVGQVDAILAAETGSVGGADGEPSPDAKQAQRLASHTMSGAAFHVDDADRGTGETLLHNACWFGHAHLVTHILDLGANINHTDRLCSLKTPLHEAARAGHWRVVELLVKRGANVLAQDATGDTALHWAVRRGRALATRALVVTTQEHEAQQDAAAVEVRRTWGRWAVVVTACYYLLSLSAELQSCRAAELQSCRALDRETALFATAATRAWQSGTLHSTPIGSPLTSAPFSPPHLLPPPPPLRLPSPLRARSHSALFRRSRAGPSV
jgi:hypothetical protein